MTSTSTSPAPNDTRHPAQLIPFPIEGARRARRILSHADDGRGRILLFTGIRYERMVDAEPASPRRKRS